MPFLQLPDGNEIQIGPDRFKVPEVLFQPVSFLASSYFGQPFICMSLLASLLWSLCFVYLAAYANVR